MLFESNTRLQGARRDNMLFESNSRLDEINESKSCCDLCYCCCCNIPSNGGTENLSKRRRGDAENDENPQYHFFLKHLKPDRTSYNLEYKKQGVWQIIKYEVDDCEPEKFEAQPTRILRSAMKKKDEPLIQPPIVTNQRKRGAQFAATADNDGITSPRRKKGSQSASIVGNDRMTRQRKKESQSASIAGNNGMTRQLSLSKSQREKTDQDYSLFVDNCSVLDDYVVFKHDLEIIVYEKRHEDLDPLKDVQSGSDSSDVEIMESPSVVKRKMPDTSLATASTLPMKDEILNLKPSASQSDFRRQMMNVLVKPYDEDEYEKLRHDVEVRKTGGRHLDLRKGREISYSANMPGKSYLDHYPDFKALLLKFEKDKRKSLNLLRGFFFWLQNSVQSGSFIPWKDAECLAVKPSRVPR